MPKDNAVWNFNEPGATCHPEAWRSLPICIARNRASGSPSVYRRLTDPGLLLNAAPSIWICCGDKVLQDSWALRRSVCNLASAASFSKPAALASCLAISAFAASATPCASLAATPALIPCFSASATRPATSNLYRSKTPSSCRLISRSHCNTSIVLTTTPAADTAPAIRLQSIAKFATLRHQVRSWPNITLSSLEEVAFIATTVSIGVMISLEFIDNCFRQNSLGLGINEPNTVR